MFILHHFCKIRESLILERHFHFQVKVLNGGWGDVSIILYRVMSCQTQSPQEGKKALVIPLKEKVCLMLRLCVFDIELLLKGVNSPLHTEPLQFCTSPALEMGTEWGLLALAYHVHWPRESQGSLPSLSKETQSFDSQDKGASSA